MRIKPALILFLTLVPGSLFAAAPYSTQPGYEPSIPTQFPASPPQRMLVPLPPHLPAYLPNGAVNLDEAWIQDGGARLYWNTVVIPKELKMAGASWVDPALVPQLFPPQTQKARPVRRYRRKVGKPRKVAKAPANAASLALTPPPTIPLPVQEVENRERDNQSSQPLPPLTAQQARPSQPVRPGDEEVISVLPPKLQ